MKNTKNIIKSEQECVLDILSIICDADMVEESTNTAEMEEIYKSILEKRAKQNSAKKVAAAPKKAKEETAPKAKEAPMVVYENGIAIQVNGKKTTTGPKRKGGKRGSKNDKGRDKLKDIFIPALEGHATYGKETFEHSAEGFVIRMFEADYAIKVSKSKTSKFDINDEEFEVVKDFTVRGKVKNSAPGIAKAILAALDEEEGFSYDLCVARASGITLQIAEGEYTIKISKKRERVGFEAEKASAYKDK